MSDEAAEKSQSMQSKQPATAEDVQRIRNYIDDLGKRSESLKPKDIWDKAAVIAVFLGSVLVATVGLVFTVIYNNREAERQQTFRESRFERLKQMSLS